MFLEHKDYYLNNCDHEVSDKPMHYLMITMMMAWMFV